MPSLPTGTVTFLFTDIEGSTTLLQHLGDQRYAEVLDEHRRILRDAFAGGHGQEIDTQGDACLVAFSRARDALGTAVAAQRALARQVWPDGTLLRVRMGLHTGEPLSRDSGYVGIDVHRAARIAAAGHGGQILVSDVTHSLVARDLPDGVSLRDLGEHRLKDLAHQHRLFQVVAAELPADFPPIRSLNALPHNLPRQLTSFIGREKEMAEVKRLLSTAYLVTLTGSGGAGKTRLALQVAADVVGSYPDGVWLAELAPIADSALVPKTAASALNVPEQPGRDMTETLIDALRPKALLLVLDNCEHLVAACRDLAAMLLRTCPQLRILATSREGLGVPGETLWRVPSLSVPEDVSHLPPPEELVLYDAVRLFVDRATATTPGFTVTRKNSPAIAQLCKRLDGIPLAIELAAARVKVVAVEQIAVRLDDRFRLLTDGSPTLLPRQQTLRATLDWSYDLLSDQEQTVLRRLSVFVGGWTLDAAETVCAGDKVAAAEILDVLTRLVDKSLVLVETNEGESRHRLSETVLDYCRDKLAESGESDRLRTEHLRFFLAFASRAHDAVIGPDRLAWLRRIGMEHDNIRSALRWSITTKAFEEAFRLGAAMARFWARRGFLEEGLRWLEALRGHETRVSERARGGVWLGLGLLAFEIGDQVQAMIAERALEVFRRIGDGGLVENCLSLLGMTENERGRFDRASAFLDEAVHLARAAGSPTQEAERLRQRGYVEVRRGDYEAAVAHLERSLELLRGSGARRSIGFGLGHLAQAYLYGEQVDRAIAILREAIVLVEAEEHSTAIAYFRNLLGLGLLKKGDYEAADRVYRENLEYSREVGHWWAAAQALIGIADVSAAKGDPQHAVRLLSAADAFLKATDYQLPLAESAYLGALIDRVRALLDLGQFEAAWAEGRAMTLEQAIEYALTGDANHRTTLQ